MSSEEHHTSYLKIIVILTIMTVVEVILGQTGLGNRSLFIAVMLTLAGVKAAMVAAYFMHLKFEKKLLTAIVIFPVILLVILTIALFPDSSAFSPPPASAQPAATSK